jgi:hypothetical protein
MASFHKRRGRCVLIQSGFGARTAGENGGEGVKLDVIGETCDGPDRPHPLVPRSRTVHDPTTLGDAADRWLSALGARGLSPDTVIA